MRVAMYYRNNDIRVEEMPVPAIGPGEILLKIMASGICGSDVMEWYRVNKAPLVLGHEVAGIVEAVGEGVNGIAISDRIVAAHHVPCNTCKYCLSGHPTVCETLRKTNFEPGGFSEFVRIPAINVDRGIYNLPEEVTYEEGTFVEPLACVYRGQQAAGMKAGKSVLILGSGIAGLMHVNLAKALGAGLIIATDINEYRRAAATSFGADLVFDAMSDIPEAVRKANSGMLADIVIVCTGAEPAIKQALASVERGGTVLFFAPTADGVAIPLSINDVFWRTEVTLTTSYAGSREDHSIALELIRSKRIDVADMITHRLSLEETQKGFEMVVSGGESIKIVIEPYR